MICVPLFLAVVLASPLTAQTVSAVNGNIVFTDATGRSSRVTESNSDSDPGLSFDGRSVVFVRETPNHKVDTGMGDVEETELWIARLDRKEAPRRVLVGHPGNVLPGPGMVLAGFSNPQFSPDGRRVYFMAAAWATSAAIHMLDLKAGTTVFLFPGLGVEVIKGGKYRGFLIGTKNPVTEDRGRDTAYWLLDPNGKEVKRIGEREDDLARFKGTSGLR